MLKYIKNKRIVNGKEVEFIRSPLTMLDGVGLKAADSIVENQPYKSLEDFLGRVDTSKVSSKVLTALVNEGSMDAWRTSGEITKENHRSALLSSYESVKKKVVKHKNEVKKQKQHRTQYSGGSLFDSFNPNGSVDI